MTRLNGLVTSLGALVLTAFFAAPAHANLQVMIIDAANPSGVVVKDTYAGQSPDAIVFNFADTDFSFNLQIAASNSPGGAIATLHADSIVQATATGVTSNCTACAAGFNLMVMVSDTSYNSPLGNGTLTQAVNTNTVAASAATGNVQFDGYLVNGGTIFATGANHVGPATFASYAVTNNTTQSVGVLNAMNPYTLTEVVGLHLTNTNQGQATANLSFAVPEPASILLLGTAMLGLARLRKKMQSRG